MIEYIPAPDPFVRITQWLSIHLAYMALPPFPPFYSLRLFPVLLLVFNRKWLCWSLDRHWGLLGLCGLWGHYVVIPKNGNSHSGSISWDIQSRKKRNGYIMELFRKCRRCLRDNCGLFSPGLEKSQMSSHKGVCNLMILCSSSNIYCVWCLHWLIMTNAAVYYGSFL